MSEEPPPPIGLEENPFLGHIISHSSYDPSSCCHWKLWLQKIELLV